MGVKEASAAYRLAHEAVQAESDVPEGYKRTEVGVIPNDWLHNPLSELARLYQPVTISAKELTEWGFPVYGANGVVGFYSKTNHDTWQITVTCRGSTCGTVNRTVAKCWITGNAMVVNCDDTSLVDKEFLYYQLCHQDLSSCITGTGQPQIVRGPLANFTLPFPQDKSEQQAIAKALSDADALIESLQQLIAKQRALKQGAMQALLNGRQRLPGFAGEWCEIEFGDVATLRNERMNPRTAAPLDFCIELEHIAPDSGQLIGYGSTNRYSSMKSVFHAGDVLFGKLRAYLRKYWLADRAGVCSTEIWCLSPKAPLSSSALLFHVVQSDAFIEAASTAYGTHMPRSEWKAIQAHTLPLPIEVEEQTAIATVLSDMDAKIEVLEARLAKTRALKAGMMQALLTGRIRLPLDKAA